MFGVWKFFVGFLGEGGSVWDGMVRVWVCADGISEGGGWEWKGRGVKGGGGGDGHRG